MIKINKSVSMVFQPVAFAHCQCQGIETSILNQCQRIETNKVLHQFYGLVNPLRHLGMTNSLISLDYV